MLGRVDGAKNVTKVAAAGAQYDTVGLNSMALTSKGYIYEETETIS